MSSTNKRIADSDWREPSSLEASLLARLLRAEFPGSLSLRQQAKSALVRDLDENGSFGILATVGDDAVVRHRVPVEGEYTDRDGVAVHVLIHVVDGRLDELEIFRDDSEPIVCSAVSANNLRVFSIRPMRD